MHREQMPDHITDGPQFEDELPEPYDDASAEKQRYYEEKYDD